MGTYSHMVLQRQNEKGEWEEVIPPASLGWSQDNPRWYGKYNMMYDIDGELNCQGYYHDQRTSFMAPSSESFPGQNAPWAGRGLPQDGVTAELKEYFEDEWDISWVAVEEVLGYNFKARCVPDWEGKMVPWEEFVGQAFRMWFERIAALGVTRVLYSHA